MAEACAIHRCRVFRLKTCRVALKWDEIFQWNFPLCLVARRETATAGVRQKRKLQTKFRSFFTRSPLSAQTPHTDTTLPEHEGYLTGSLHYWPRRGVSSVLSFYNTPSFGRFSVFRIRIGRTRRRPPVRFGVYVVVLLAQQNGAARICRRPRVRPFAVQFADDEPWLCVWIIQKNRRTDVHNEGGLGPGASFQFFFVLSKPFWHFTGLHNK